MVDLDILYEGGAEEEGNSQDIGTHDMEEGMHCLGSHDPNVYLLILHSEGQAQYPLCRLPACRFPCNAPKSAGVSHVHISLYVSIYIQ